ncbi:MAG: PQQ-binding-like beta-propeller repeat protein [Jatrophihabitantaceae bacterium]
MSVDGPRLEEPQPRLEEPQSRSRSEFALEQYRARVRPRRIAYAVAITVVFVLALVAVKIAYSHGEISYAKLKTAGSAAPSVALKAPSPTLTPAWTTADHTAIGTPYWGGTVITYSAHSVVGRDGQTGAVRWSYTRSDRTVCTAVQMSGLTLAIFELNGNCDQVTTVDSATGARKWTRTFDEDGAELDGRPTYLVTADTLMMTTPHAIYAIEPVSGYNRWVFAQPDCTISGAALGSAGALISQTCAHPDCSGLTYCGPGPQLLLRDPITAQSSDAKNPDQIKWDLVGNTATPVSADAVISAVQAGSTRLAVLSADKGRTLSTLTLKAPAAGPPAALPTAATELIRVGGLTYCVNAAGTGFLWSVPTTTLPTVTSTDGAPTADLSAAYVAVPVATGIALLNGSTGEVGSQYAVQEPAGGSQVYPFGTGFVVAGPSTVLYR